MQERFEGENMYAYYSAICGPIWFSFGALVSLHVFHILLIYSS